MDARSEGEDWEMLVRRKEVMPRLRRWEGRGREVVTVMDVVVVVDFGGREG